MTQDTGFWNGTVRIADSTPGALRLYPVCARPGVSGSIPCARGGADRARMGFRTDHAGAGRYPAELGR